MTFKFIFSRQKHIHPHSHMMEKFEVHVFSSFEARRVIPMTSRYLHDLTSRQSIRLNSFIYYQIEKINYKDRSDVTRIVYLA